MMRNPTARPLVHTDTPRFVGALHTRLIASLKGVIAFDESQGFWLIHSVPRVPPQLKDGFAFRSDATIYGQSMICVTLCPYVFLCHLILCLISPAHP